MSEANVDLVRRWFAGLQRGELSPEICDEEILIRNWDESPVRGPYHGHTGLRQWWADFAEAFEDIHLELKEAISVDDERVVTGQHVVGRFRLPESRSTGPSARSSPCGTARSSPRSATRRRDGRRRRQG